MDVITALMALKLQTNLSKDINSCLGVFGLSSNTTERDLREVFSKYGPLSYVHMVHLQSRRSQGFAFVDFEKRDDAATVMADEF